jgi:8-oxo-dGTP pyrophosphatase MutT (NUDIX family)
MEQHFLGKVATKAIIIKDGKILMTRDNRDTVVWDLPGGRINVGESIELGLKREIMEELGVDINFNGVVYSEQLVHTSEGSPHLFITCKATLADEKKPFLIPSEELAEAKWVDQNTIGELKTYDNCMRALNTFWKS